MANRSTTAKATTKSGNEMTFQQHETDSPIIPVAQMERLQAFKPEAVDFIIAQTKAEAEHRREQDGKINDRVFIEHVIGQVFALIIGCGGIYAGSVVALAGQAWAGATIATASITGLAVVFLTGRAKPPRKQ